jgi:predicted neutral ceramidase superfamily lipid hydrolase
VLPACPPKERTAPSAAAQVAAISFCGHTLARSQSLASQLFAASLFPYLAFLFFLTRSGKAPRLTLVGFYFLLAFVGATIPAGIYGAWGSRA